MNRALLLVVVGLATGCEPPCTPGEMDMGLSPSRLQLMPRAPETRVQFHAPMYPGTCTIKMSQPDRTEVKTPDGKVITLGIPDFPRKPDGASVSDVVTLDDILHHVPGRQGYGDFTASFQPATPGVYNIDAYWGEVKRSAYVELMATEYPVWEREFPIDCGGWMWLDEASSLLMCYRPRTIYDPPVLIEQLPTGITNQLESGFFKNTPRGRLLAYDGGIGWLADGAPMASWVPAAFANWRITNMAANETLVVTWELEDRDGVDGGVEWLVIRDADALTTKYAELELKPEEGLIPSIPSTCSRESDASPSLVVSDDTIAVTRGFRVYVRLDADGGWYVADKDRDVAGCDDVVYATGNTYWRCGGSLYEYGKLEGGQFVPYASGTLPGMLDCFNMGTTVGTSVSISNLIPGNTTVGYPAVTVSLGAQFTDAGVVWRVVEDPDGVTFYDDWIVSHKQCIGCTVANTVLGHIQ